MLELRGSWWGRARAGDCELAAWRLLAAAEPERAATHRDAAVTHYRAALASLGPLVAKDPADPWQGVPWGFAHLGLAEIEAERGDTSAALALLDVGLPALARVEANAHRDVWDEERAAAGRALRARLAQR